MAFDDLWPPLRMSSPTTPQTVPDLGFAEGPLIEDVADEILNNLSDSLVQQDCVEHVKHVAPSKPARRSLPTPETHFGKGKAAARTEAHIGPAAAKPDADAWMAQQREPPVKSSPPGMTYSPGPKSPDRCYNSFTTRRSLQNCSQPGSAPGPSISQQGFREGTLLFGRPLPPLPPQPALSKHNEPSSKPTLCGQQTSHEQPAHLQASRQRVKKSVDKGLVHRSPPLAQPQPTSHGPHALQETVSVKHNEPSNKSASHEQHIPHKQQTSSNKQGANTHSACQRSEQAVSGELIEKISDLNLSEEYKHQERASQRSRRRLSSYGEHIQPDRHSERNAAESRRRAARHSLDDAEDFQTRSHNTQKSLNSAVPVVRDENAPRSAEQNNGGADDDYDHLPGLTNELYDGYREARTAQQEVFFQTLVAAEASAKIVVTIGGVVYEAARSSEARRMASSVVHQVRTVSREAARVVATETPLYEFVGAIPGFAVDAVQWSVARTAQLSDTLARTKNGEPEPAIKEDATKSPGIEEWEEIDAEEEVFQKSVMPESNNDLADQLTPFFDNADN